MKRDGSGTAAGLHVCGTGGGRATAVNCTFVGNAIAIDADQKGEAILESCTIAPTAEKAVNSTTEKNARVSGLESCRLLPVPESAGLFPEEAPRGE